MPQLIGIGVVHERISTGRRRRRWRGSILQDSRPSPVLEASARASNHSGGQVCLYIDVSLREQVCGGNAAALWRAEA